MVASVAGPKGNAEGVGLLPSGMSRVVNRAGVHCKRRRSDKKKEEEERRMKKEEERRRRLM